MTKGLRVLKVQKDSRKGINELHPKKKYKIWIQELGECRIVTGDRTTVEEALVATAKALGGTKTDLKAIKFTVVGGRTIRAFRVTPEAAGFVPVVPS